MKAEGEFKVCSRCRKKQPISNYHKNKTQSDGHHNWCKDCLLEFRECYKSKKQEYDKQYHLDNHKRKCKNASDWYYTNYDKSLLNHKVYYQNHKKENTERTRNWRRDNPDKARKIQGRQKAKRRNLGFVKLWNNPFPDDVAVDMHHINDMLVIPMPKRIHNICSNNCPGEHRERCNVWLYYIYGINVDSLLNS